MEFDSRITQMSLPGLMSTTGREVHADDAFDAAFEQRRDVPSSAEAWKEHVLGNFSEQSDHGVDFGLCELTIVMDVSIEIGHDVVVRSDVEL
jgi:hypothetical protein